MRNGRQPTNGEREMQLVGVVPVDRLRVASTVIFAAPNSAAACALSSDECMERLPIAARRARTLAELRVALKHSRRSLLRSFEQFALARRIKSISGWDAAMVVTGCKPGGCKPKFFFCHWGYAAPAGTRRRRGCGEDPSNLFLAKIIGTARG